MLSGLWHQRQDRGHPLKKTVVRMPGPSCVAKRLISKMIPFTVYGCNNGMKKMNTKLSEEKRVLSGYRVCGKEQESEGLYHPALVKAFAKTVIQGIMIMGISKHKTIYTIHCKYTLFLCHSVVISV